jgi:16S rRNA (uracil1498-N3)-methyltransferase
MTRAVMTEPLFYCATLDAAGDLALTGDEARHVKAQRLKAGDRLALFDGHGLVADGEVQSLGRDEVRIAVGQRRRTPPPTARIELYCAVPKGDRVAVLLDMATQLGMSRFTPIRWDRSVAEPGARAAERWRRICLEACKQSRRLHVPEIAAATTPAEAAARARGAGARTLLAHPNGGAIPAGALDAEDLALFVGPEGGLTDVELRTLRDAGAHRIRLGNAILRIETAAVALVAAVNSARAAAGMLA